MSGKLADLHKVTDRTIKRDAQYARAVNAVDKAASNGEARALVTLTGQSTEWASPWATLLAYFCHAALERFFELYEEYFNQNQSLEIDKSIG